jgi:hypothetical protein
VGRRWAFMACGRSSVRRNDRVSMVAINPFGFVLVEL